MKIYNKITPERNKKNEHYNNTMFDVYNYQYPNYGYTDNIETLTIPKTIHQLWVGDKLIPGHCKQFVDRMKKINPDYEHKFWGNEIFDLYKDDIFLQEYLTDPELYKWAFICDRLRLLLLRDYGGIYCDVDAKPIQSFNIVRNSLSPVHTFFSGVKPSQKNSTLIDCTVYGSAPHSRMIYECLNTYRNIKWANGCRMFSEKIIRTIGPDVALFGYQYFYDNKVTDKTIVLHDVRKTRLFSWRDKSEIKLKTNGKIN